MLEPKIYFKGLHLIIKYNQQYQFKIEGAVQYEHCS